jgi:hypothetical protein
MEPDTQEPQHNISYEAIITNHTSETCSIAHGTGQHVEEPVTTFVEILTSYMNLLFSYPLILLLTYMRYLDAFYSYYFLPGSTTTPSFGMNSSNFGFPEGICNSLFSITLIVNTVASYSLPET